MAFGEYISHVERQHTDGELESAGIPLDHIDRQDARLLDLGRRLAHNLGSERLLQKAEDGGRGAARQLGPGNQRGRV